jgi:RNA polymerase sigma-70 factor, ECF subfamily
VTDKEAVYYELLVLRCRKRQQDAQEELVRAWNGPLHYYIRRLVDDEQESLQVLQQTWVHVLHGLGRLREPRRLPAWLYSIARKTAMTRLRRKYSENAFREDNGGVPPVQESSESGFDDAEQVHYGLGRISLVHREVLTLYFLQDLSLEEIAGVVGIPVGTVKSRLHHAKGALRAVLDQEESKHERT